LGPFPDWLYEQSELQMRSGDKVLLFTDGLVEACNADEESFGEHNLIRIARENPTASAEKLMGLLIRAAWQHGGEHFEDDASLIVLKAIERATLGLDGGIQ
jgi:sigma-B regulation protein RsbU (phosphoserine phosphatase)